MGTLNVGVSTKGNATAQQTFKKLIVTDAVKVIKGKKYDDVINKIKTAWIGEDADIFVANFKKTVNNICTDLEVYHKQIADVMNMTESEFKTFRSKHVAAE